MQFIYLTNIGCMIGMQFIYLTNIGCMIGMQFIYLTNIGCMIGMQFIVEQWWHDWHAVHLLITDNWSRSAFRTFT